MKFYPRPQECDICADDISDKPFVDGKTQWGPWACMCLACHENQGFGLGTGRGQKYDHTGTKIEG